MSAKRFLTLLIIFFLSVSCIVGIVFAANSEANSGGTSSGSIFCEAPSISVKDQFGQPVENAVISVTFSSGTASKALDVTTPVSGTVTLGAVPGSYTFELKSVPSAYTMGSTTKIVQDCQDGKAMDGKTFTVTNNVVTAVATAASGSSGGSVDFNPVFSFDSVQNFALNIMEQNPEFKAYIISIIQESKSQDSQPSESENVSVPNLIGLSQNEAKTALANAGLLLGDVSFVPDGESFHVSEQSVSPGESIARNSTINLAIFTGHPAPTPLPAYPN